MFNLNSCPGLPYLSLLYYKIIIKTFHVLKAYKSKKKIKHCKGGKNIKLKLKYKNIGMEKLIIIAQFFYRRFLLIFLLCDLDLDLIIQNKMKKRIIINDKFDCK